MVQLIIVPQHLFCPMIGIIHQTALNTLQCNKWVHIIPIEKINTDSYTTKHLISSSLFTFELIIGDIRHLVIEAKLELLVC